MKGNKKQEARLRTQEKVKSLFMIPDSFKKIKT
jgi:hypothetical protein